MKIRSVKFNVFMNFIYTASTIVFPMITYPYLTRVLPVEYYGKLTFATSVITYITMIASLGIPTYGIRACAKVRDDPRALSKTVQELLIINTATTILSFCLFVILLFSVPRFSEDKTLLAILSINMLLNVVGVNWLYSALEQYAYITVRSVIFKVLSIVLMFIFVRKPSDYIIYGGITVFATSGANILNFINIRKYVTLKRNEEQYDFKQHMKPVLIFFASAAATSVYTNLDTILLGLIQDDTQVGYYNAAVKIKTILIALVTSLGTVLLPRLSYYVQKKYMDGFKKMILVTFNFVFIFASAITAYFVIYARESIVFLSTAKYEAATLPMMLLTPTVLFVGLSNITGIQVLTPIGQEKKVLISIVWGAVADIVINVALCPFYGPVGTALAGFAAEFVVLFVQCWYLRDRIKAHIKELSIIKPVISLFIACICGILLKRLISLSPFPMLCLSAAVFFSVYGVSLLLMKEPFVCSVIRNAAEKIRRRK